MATEIEGNLILNGESIAIVVARFNDLITKRLLDGARNTLVRHGGSDENITVVHVPGSFEIPLIADRLAKSGKFAAVICLGAVIKGATPHNEYVANEATKGIDLEHLDLAARRRARAHRAPLSLRCRDHAGADRVDER